jgi:hypothetical protein
MGIPANSSGPGRLGRDQVVAAVQGRAEDDVRLVEQGERSLVAGDRDMGGVGADDRHPIGARRQQVGQARGQAVAEVAGPLGQQPEPGSQAAETLPGLDGREAQPWVRADRTDRRQGVGQHGGRRPGRPCLPEGRHQPGLGQPGHRFLGDHGQRVPALPARVPGRCHRPVLRVRVAVAGRRVAAGCVLIRSRSVNRRQVTPAMEALARRLPRSDPDTLLAPAARGR